LSSFFKKIISPELSDVVFDNISKLSFIRSNKSLNSIITILSDANLDKNTRYEIVSYLVSSVEDLSIPNITEQQINTFWKKTINFLNLLSNKIPEDKFKQLIKTLLDLWWDNSKEIDLSKFIDYIKNLDYSEIFQLIKANFWKIKEIIENLISRWINKISLEDFLLEVFKSNILNDISKDLGYKLVEEIRKIAALDIKSLLVEWRRQLLGSEFSIRDKFNKKLNSSIEWKVPWKIATNLVDGLILRFRDKIKKELSSWDEKLTQKEIINILKDQAEDFINHNPKLLVEFLKESGYKVDKNDIKLLQNFSLKIINHPKFDHIAKIFINNISNIVSVKKDIISSFKEIVKEIQESSKKLVFSKEVTQDVKTILLDNVYSPSFNKHNIGTLVNFLDKNNMLPENIDKEKIAKFISILPSYIPKKGAEKLLSSIDFKKLDKINYTKLILDAYDSINDKNKFINEILDLNIIEFWDSSKEKKQLDSQQIDLITEIIYKTVNSSDEISLSETVEKIFSKAGYDKLNHIKIFNQNLAYLTVDFVQATPKENFKELLKYINKNILYKNKLNQQDYIKLWEKILSLTDSKDFIHQMKAETRQNPESKFLLNNFDKFKSIWEEDKQNLIYLLNNSNKALKILEALKVSNDSEAKFMKEYTWKVFDEVNHLTNKFSKEEFAQFLDIIINKKYPIDGVEFGGNSIHLSEEVKSKLKRNFVFNNFWFSLWVAFDFLKNGFKIDKVDVIYSYFKDKWNKDDLQDTISDSISKKS
jgi:hypothetical protein